MSTGMTLTNTGRDMLASALAGSTLTFTRAYVGNGDLGSRNPLTMTALVSPKKELPIQAMRTSSTGTAEVVLQMSNSGMSSGFFVKEYGLFAKLGNGTEKLYAYCNKGNEAPYLEGYDGTNPIDYTLSIVTVIDQAQNVTAIISSTNNYVTLTALNAKLEALFAPSTTNLKGLWTYAPNDERRLRPLPMDEARVQIMGINDINNLVYRIERLEDAINRVSLELNLQGIFPGASHYMAEDFVDPDTVDRYTAKVTSIVAGDDSIDCLPVDGMLPGSWYVISDGLKSERVQVESISLENDIQRVILKDTVKNTYKLKTCKLYRSSANVTPGGALGSGTPKVIEWLPSITFKGRGLSYVYTEKFYATPNNPASCTFTGYIKADSEGYITLGRD